MLLVYPAWAKLPVNAPSLRLVEELQLGEGVYRLEAVNGYLARFVYRTTLYSKDRIVSVMQVEPGDCSRCKTIYPISIEEGVELGDPVSIVEAGSTVTAFYKLSVEPGEIRSWQLTGAAGAHAAVIIVDGVVASLKPSGGTVTIWAVGEPREATLALVYNRGAYRPDARPKATLRVYRAADCDTSLAASVYNEASGEKIRDLTLNACRLAAEARPGALVGQASG